MSLLLYVSDVAPYEVSGARVPAGVHRSLGLAGIALEEVAALQGMEFVHARGPKEAGETLQVARVLALFTIGETAWDSRQRVLIEERAKRGELGLLGLHSATDSAYGWAAFGELLGARFAGHPVTARLPVRVLDRYHPATAHLPSPWLFEEELYVFRDMAADVRALLAVRLAELGDNERKAVIEHLKGPMGEDAPELLPLAWCIERSQLRSIYTVLGHFLAAYEDTRYIQHLSGAVQWLVSPLPARERTVPTITGTTVPG